MVLTVASVLLSALVSGKAPKLVDKVLGETCNESRTAILPNDAEVSGLIGSDSSIEEESEPLSVGS